MDAQSTTDLPEDQRRTIFLALVGAQDEGLSVPNSPEMVAGRFGLTLEVVKRIEREGLDHDWLS